MLQPWCPAGSMGMGTEGSMAGEKVSTASLHLYELAGIFGI